MSTTAETLRIAKNENLAAPKRVASVLWRLLKIVPWRKVAKFTAGIITGLCIAAVQFIGLLAHAAHSKEENSEDTNNSTSFKWSDETFATWADKDGGVKPYDTGGIRLS